MSETFEEVWGRVDQERIAQAIGPDILNEFDFQDAKLCVYTAAQRWLVRDITEFAIDGIETRRDLENINVKLLGGFKGFLDICGTMKGECKEFKPYTGKKFILDWKSAKAALDVKWKDRQIFSSQWRYYCAAADPVDLFFYRGVRRPTKFGGEVDFRELIIEVPNHNYQEATEDIVGKMTARKALITAGLEVWPRNMPSACYEFGRVCPYFDDCDTYTMPRRVVDIEKEMSYSRLKVFASCPERHRRDLLNSIDGIDDDENENTIFGSAFHRGMAELYSQVFNIPYVKREH